MRHLHTGRKLGVSAPHRVALLRNLTLAIVERESIRTTPARAKELRWFAERVVTLAKRGDLSARRRIFKLLGTSQTGQAGVNRVHQAVSRIYDRLVPRFLTRPGGYTQIIRLAQRRPGDNAEMCFIQYIPAEEDTKHTSKAGQKKGAKKSSTEAKAKKTAHAHAHGDKAHQTKTKSEPEDKPSKAKKKTDGDKES